jgi:hypothetical protein
MPHTDCLQHVLVFAKDGARHVKLYLDNERISEAGFSFEMNVCLR